MLLAAVVIVVVVCSATILLCADRVCLDGQASHHLRFCGSFSSVLNFVFCKKKYTYKIAINSQCQKINYLFYKTDLAKECGACETTKVCFGLVVACLPALSRLLFACCAQLKYMLHAAFD